MCVSVSGRKSMASGRKVNYSNKPFTNLIILNDSIALNEHHQTNKNNEIIGYLHLLTAARTLIFDE
jgi:hypothetical protein